MELQARTRQALRERNAQDVFDKFSKMNSTKFHGDADPYVAGEVDQLIGGHL